MKYNINCDEYQIVNQKLNLIERIALLRNTRENSSLCMSHEQAKECIEQLSSEIHEMIVPAKEPAITPIDYNLPIFNYSIGIKNCDDYTRDNKYNNITNKYKHLNANIFIILDDSTTVDSMRCIFDPKNK